MAGKFLISKSKNGQFKFVLKAGNGEVILSSELYKAKASATNGIASVRKNAAEDKRFERKTAKNKKEYFNLKAGNGQIIETSQMYKDAKGRDNGIKSVVKNAPTAKVVDETV